MKNTAIQRFPLVDLCFSVVSAILLFSRSGAELPQEEMLAPNHKER
jgi:hypothetical protein